MKKIQLFFIFTCLICFGSINSFGQVGVQNIKICVISDLHYFDTTLLINDGPAFQMYLAQDRKLLKESHAIMSSLTDSIISENPAIVLITGDLTKDGEYSSHQKILQFLLKMKNANIKVFVTPGNHDINNPHAFSFNYDTVYPVASITPTQFKTLYNNYGYSQALKTDTASLSYISEPVPGLQILSMDVCRYDSNYVNMEPTTNGGFKPQVLNWVKDRLKEAKQNHKIVIGMQHHNLIEHYSGQGAIFSEYLIDDFDTISSQLADLGLKVVFTGHYHAQDVVKKTSTYGNSIYDVETGSAITYPCPYRILNLTLDTMLNINGNRVEQINYNTGPLSFQQYALYNIQTGLPPQIIYMLMSPPYSVDSATAYTIEPAITETFIAHFGGNENSPTPQTTATINMLIQSPYAFIGYILQGMWNDPNPDDWNVSIDMRSPTFNGIAETTDLKKIILFPNPSNGIFNLLLPEIKNKILINIYDNNGRLIYVKESNENRNIIIDISDKTAGIYIIKLIINDTVLSKKFIIH